MVYKIKQFLRLRYKWVVGVVVTLLVLGGVGVGWAMNGREDLASPVPEIVEPVEVLGMEDEVEEVLDESMAVLLLGYGGPGHDGPYLADAIQVLIIDPVERVVGLVSIPRDTLVMFPDGRRRKVNQALSYGMSQSSAVGGERIVEGGRVARDVIGQMLGMEINNFAGVDFVGFKRIIGQELVGLKVQVEIPVNDPWYPVRGLEVETCGKSSEEVAELTRRLSGFELERQFPCRYEHVNIQPGLVEMHGSEALAYARSRHGSSDFDRSRRQQAILMALAREMLDLSKAKDRAGLVRQFGQHLAFDMDDSTLELFVATIRSLWGSELRQVTLSIENVLVAGQLSGYGYSLTPRSGVDDWSGVGEYVRGEIVSRQ